MARVTFCPHHLIEIKNDITPEVIEKFYVRPLVDFINIALANGLVVCMSKSLISDFENTHPWHLMNDQNWKKWLVDWNAILKPLLGRVKVIEHGASINNSIQRCTSLSASVNNVFCDFLDEFASHSFADNSNEEAVFTPTPWCSGFHDFITVKKPGDIKFAMFTWYKIYPDNLPCSGQVPFIPPTNWIRNMAPMKGGSPGFGYIDCNQREWIWDRLHNNHWDVQNRARGRGNYQNISPEGQILGED